MIRPLFWLLLWIASTQAEEWTHKYCKEENKKLICENVNLPKEELDKEGVYSDKDEVVIKKGDVYVLEDKFFSKFPKCTKLHLIDVNLKLGSLHGKWNTESVVLEHCNITGIKDSNLISSLPKLSAFGLLESNLDYKVLDKHILGENLETKWVIIMHNDFESVSEDAFAGLPNLENIELGELQASFPTKLFESKPKLKSIKLSYNSLTKFPKECLPEGLTELGLKSNKISKLSSEDFMNFKSSKTLERLYLGGNGIEKLDVGVFDELENLKVLYLDYNKLNDVSKKHFEKLKHLKRLVLDGNQIKNSDVKDLGIEVDV